MLDLSGRHYGQNDPSLKGKRMVDHRELPDELSTESSGSENMMKFMSESGAMWHSPETGGVEISANKTPSKQQLMTLAKHYANNPEGLTVEISNPNNGEIVNSTHIKKPSYSALVAHFKKIKGK